MSFFDNFGKYEEKKQKLKKELQHDLHQHLQSLNSRRSSHLTYAQYSSDKTPNENFLQTNEVANRSLQEINGKLSHYYRSPLSSYATTSHYLTNNNYSNNNNNNNDNISMMNGNVGIDRRMGTTNRSSMNRYDPSSPKFSNNPNRVQSIMANAMEVSQSTQDFLYKNQPLYNQADQQQQQQQQQQYPTQEFHPEQIHLPPIQQHQYVNNSAPVKQQQQQQFIPSSNRFPTDRTIHQQQNQQSMGEYRNEIDRRINELSQLRNDLAMATGNGRVIEDHNVHDEMVQRQLAADRNQLENILTRSPLSNNKISYNSPKNVNFHQQPQQFAANNFQPGIMPSLSSNNSPSISSRGTNQSRPDLAVFPSDRINEKNEKENKMLQHRAALEQQMEEKRQRKQREKLDKQKYEERMEAEQKRYQYFGKMVGGGGTPNHAINSPLSSTQRNIVSVPNMNLSPDQNHFPPQPINPIPVNNTNLKKNLEMSYQSDGKPTDVEGHARGGNGIFGQPLSTEEKDKSEKYKNELLQQIEEKRRREMEKREKDRIEEEKIAKRLEEQNRHQQQEFEEEQKRKQEKMEEEKRKTEELKEREIEQREQQRKIRLQKEKEQDEQSRRKMQQQNQKRYENERKIDEEVVPTLRKKVGDTKPKPSPSPSTQNYPLDVIKSEDTLIPPRNDNLDKNTMNKSENDDIDDSGVMNVLQQMKNLSQQLQMEKDKIEGKLKKGNTNRYHDIDNDQKLFHLPPNKFDHTENFRKPKRVSRTGMKTNKGYTIGNENDDEKIRHGSALVSDSKFVAVNNANNYGMNNRRDSDNDSILSISNQRQTNKSNLIQDNFSIESFDVDQLSNENDKRIRRLQTLPPLKDEDNQQDDDLFDGKSERIVENFLGESKSKTQNSGNFARRPSQATVMSGFEDEWMN
ncbi:hypothetical protein SNEBB_009542 [Seison nebaliae]|nr:hypothetical protein SNEBB_009542 [Seison nebaliae]